MVRKSICQILDNRSDFAAEQLCARSILLFIQDLASRLSGGQFRTGISPTAFPELFARNANFWRRMSNSLNTSDTDGQVPVYVIDLSLPPRDRYVSLAAQYMAQIQQLTSLLDDLLLDLGIPLHMHVWIKRAARLLLRRLHSSEETEELHGISRTVHVPMYLLVSFNVILDLLMGCTSGAVRSLDRKQEVIQTRMLHFRTLDWGMDPLRSVIVQLDFIRSKSSTPQKILASSITYVGFVGVLTGVRQNLSMSLNFRGVHNATTRTEQFRFYLQHLLVLLGLKQAIPSLLRSYLLDTRNSGTSRLATLASEIPSKHSTAAYLIFSDGRSTITMEKDYDTAVIRRSESFIVMTNHDLSFSPDAGMHNDSSRAEIRSIAEFLSESFSRRSCMIKKWEAKVRREERRRKKAGNGLEVLDQVGIELPDWNAANEGSTRRASNRSKVASSREKDPKLVPDTAGVEVTVSLTTDEVINWVSGWPTTNESTHFAAVLDPTAGKVLWVERYPIPVEET